MSSQTSDTPTQFRRIDVIAVIVIIAVLAALVIPAIQQAREAARRTQSKNNLKQIGLALLNYQDANNCLPAGGIFEDDGRGYHGWMVSILPYVDSSPVYNSIDFNQPWDSPRNAGELMFKMSGYQNPGESTPEGPWQFSLAHYSANAHLLAANRWISLKKIDSQQQTFLAAELAGDFVPWVCPYNWRPLTTLNGEPPTYGRYSKDGCYMLFVDGHVEFVANKLFPSLKQSLSGPDLAGFGETPLKIVRPATFPVPQETLKHSWIRLDDYRGVSTRQDYRGKIVRLNTDPRDSKRRGDGLVHDSDIAKIGGYVDLEELDLAGDFSGSSLYRLQQLKHLRKLLIHSDHITDKDLSFVEQLPNLKVLRVDGKQITKEVRQKLRKRLENCEVLPDDS